MPNPKSNKDKENDPKYDKNLIDDNQIVNFENRSEIVKNIIKPASKTVELGYYTIVFNYYKFGDPFLYWDMWAGFAYTYDEAISKLSLIYNAIGNNIQILRFTRKEFIEILNEYQVANEH